MRIFARSSRLAVAGTALVFLTALPAAAQGGMSLKAGTTFNKVSNTGVLPGSLDGRTGFAAGLAFGSRGGVLGFGFEALYAQRGLDSEGTTSLGERRLDYIDVPVVVEVRLPTPGVQPFAYAGPQVSFELRCRSGDTDCPDTEPSGEERAKTTFAGVIGGGVRLGSATRFSIEGRYVYSLTDLKLGTITDSESYKSRSFMILVGIGF